MIVETLMLILLASGIIQCLLWVIFGLVIRTKNKKAEPINARPVSIVICAKNEAKNLKKNLPLVLNQDYPAFEVIVVDDQSTDETPQILKNFQRTFSNLKVISSQKPAYLKGKRWALKKGIEHSIYEWVLMTDADCAPSSDQWIKKMMALSEEEKSVVLGLGPYHKRATWVNGFARYENLYTAILYSSSTQLGIPFMGVGRNILYQKSRIDLAVLEQEKISGDDDMMVNRISNAKNTAVQMDGGALCYSEAPLSWKGFWKQKKRHVSTSIEYRWIHILWLNLINGSQAIFHLLSLLLLFVAPFWVVCWVILRGLAMIFAWNPLLKLTHSKELIWRIPLLDYGLSLYFLMLAFTLFKREQEW